MNSREKKLFRQAVMDFICNDDIDNVIDIITNEKIDQYDELIIWQPFENEETETVIDMVNEKYQYYQELNPEIRVYWLSSNGDYKIEFSSDKIENLTKEEKEYFITEAENEGNVCTLAKFQTELNSETWFPDTNWVLITD